MEGIAKLVDRTKLGDESALGELFHSHRSMLEKFASLEWGMGNDCEDATQKVFIRLPSALQTYEHRSDAEFRGYLIEMTAQECRKLKRTWKRRVKPESDSIDDPNAFDAISKTSNAASEDVILLRVCIEQTLAKMSELQRTTILSVAESGDTLDAGGGRGAAFARSLSARKHFEKIWAASPEDVIAERCTKLNDYDVRRIRAMGMENVYTHQDIADIYGITKSFVGNIIAGRARRFIAHNILTLAPLRITTNGPCIHERACVFPGLFDNLCRTHSYDRQADYSVTRPGTGHSWLRTTIRHTYWDHKGPSLRRSRSHIKWRSNRQKLDDSAVRRIRQLKAEGISGCKIAKRFGVGETCVRNVINGLTFADVV